MKTDGPDDTLSTVQCIKLKGIFLNLLPLVALAFFKDSVITTKNLVMHFIWLLVYIYIYIYIYIDITFYHRLTNTTTFSQLRLPKIELAPFENVSAATSEVAELREMPNSSPESHVRRGKRPSNSL